MVKNLKAVSYIKIIRPLNLGIVALTQVLFHECVVKTFLGLSAVEPVMGWFDVSVLVLSTVLITAGGYVINDYFDVEADDHNKPEKRIAGSVLSLKSLLVYYWILTTAGVAAGMYLALRFEFLQLGFIFPVVAIFLWLYSSRYQKTVLYGNLIVAVLSGLVILVFWLFEFFALKTDPIRFVDSLKQVNYLQYLAIAYSLFALLVSLMREIVKDVEDREGDQPVGSRTLPIVYGVSFSRNIVLLVHLITMALLGWCQVHLYVENLHLVFWYVTCAVQLLFLFVLFQLITARKKGDFHFLSSAYKVIMLAGILSMQLFYISY